MNAEDYVPRDLRRRRGPSLLGKRISLQLLRTRIPPSPRETAAFEEAMVQLRLTSGIYRTTFRERFRDLDPVVNALIADRFSSDARLVIHDWAASHCLTSSEWAASLFRLFPNATFVASDLTMFLIEVTLPDGAAFVLQPDGGALQYIRKPFVIRLSPPEPKMLFVNHVMGRMANARLTELRQTLNIPQTWLDSDAETLSIPPYHLRRIPMTHPEARELAQRDERFSIRRHSAFEPLAEPAGVVRTMNLLTTVYFTDSRIGEGARAVWQSLVPNGFWIVGRTMEETLVHNASVLKKTPGGFDVVARIGDGSDIERQVLAL
ncbi:MAG: hypothetical protein M3P06_10610 [Acidobacteriota bacterium]|nr:hypothetical protein [Acidobacteriota bacterium]